MDHSEIPYLPQISAKPVNPSDPEQVRVTLHGRIIELEDALRGMLGLVDLLHYSGKLDHDPRTNHRYVEALEVLK